MVNVALGILAVAAAFLLRPKVPKPSPTDGDTPVTTSKRGEYLPRICGGRRVGPFIAWVGERVWTNGEWLEEAWHCLCVGPARKLTAIYVNGENILTTPLDSQTTPSGSTITISGKGGFRIYWGEINQPINSNLGGKIGVSSRWPHICYVQWTFFHLGSGSPTWPTIEYGVEVRPANYSQELGLFGNLPWLSGTAEGNYADSGPNAGHLIYELLFAQHPLGLGLPTERFNITDIALIADIHDSGVDYQYASIVAKGESLKEVLGYILRELGWGLRFSDTDGRLRLMWISYTASVPLITEEMIVGPLPEYEVNASDKQKTGVVYAFNDRQHNFEQSVYGVDDDGRAGAVGSPNAKRIELSTITDRYRASVVGQRLSQFELATDFAVQFETQFDGRFLFPTQAFTLEGIACQLRVLSIKRFTDAPKVKIVAIRDALNTQQVGAVSGNDPYVEPVIVLYDNEFSWITAPAALNAGLTAVIPLRLRAGTHVAGSRIYASGDDVAFTEIGIDRSSFPGGVLIDAIASGTANPAPTVTANLEEDLSQVLDLQADPDSLNAGRQLCIINDEIFFLEYITNLGGGVFRLEGLQRAKFGTVAANHAIGDAVFICRDTDLSLMRGALIETGQTRYLRSVPFFGVVEGDLDNAASVSGTV